jgi:membrane dipeptidase
MRRWIAMRPDKYRLVQTVGDVHRCKADAKLGICFDVEGMSPVQDNPSLVQTFYELGVRWMLIAYNRNNRAGGGCMDTDGGLTSTGLAVIDEMERVGMVLCLSHAGARTAMEALEYSRKPVIFSHSNPAGVLAHARNISDDLIKACARKRGVVGLSGLSVFLGAGTDLLARLLHQLRYVIDLVGPQHVGLSLDYAFDQEEVTDYVRANPTLFPPGLDTMTMVEPEDFGAIAEQLARDNLSEDDIRAILGGNWLRIATEVWR